MVALLALGACSEDATFAGDVGAAADTRQADRGNGDGPRPDRGRDRGVDRQCCPDRGAKPDLHNKGKGPFDGCRAHDACKVGKVCNFANGRCETRIDWPAPAPVLFSFHPMVAAPGDVLVLDGARFWPSAFQVSAKVKVGGTSLAPYPPLLDSTRLLVPVTAPVGGALELTTGGGKKLSGGVLIKSPTGGPMPCSAWTMPAAGSAGTTPRAAGPHGAGYRDLKGATTARLFYPAKCGGVRTAPVAGTHPLVVLMHGNGAGYLNYEFLGQHLATWGFLALLPDAKVDYKASDIVKITPAQVATLAAAIKVARGGGGLPGVKAGAKVAFIGHSRGSARIQAVLAADKALAAATVASVFLGPVDDGKVVPGLFLLVAGTRDSQSPGYIHNTAYGRQKPPKWRVVVQGGNHSLFSDHKVWSGFLDQKPTVTRAQQHGVVASFTLPLLQRAFGLKQPFKAQLDSPPASKLYKVTVGK